MTSLYCNVFIDTEIKENEKKIFNAITLLTSFKGELYELLVYTISHSCIK